MDNLPAITAEIAQIEGIMGTPAYWRDEPTQMRLRDLYDARDSTGNNAIEAEPGDAEYVAREMALPSLKAFAAAAPGASFGDFLGIARQVSDVVFSLPDHERAGLVAGFNRLPDAVAGAIATELSNPLGTGFAYCSDAEVRKFAGDKGGSVVREWGGEAAVLMARVRARINRCMDLMSDANMERFLDWHESLSDAQAAAVYRKLAA